MGRRLENGGVKPMGDRIEVRFSWRGRDMRPTIALKPTAANLQHAARLRKSIADEIRNGTFDLAEHFPDYKFLERNSTPEESATFDDVRNAFLKWVATRQEHSSVASLKRKISYFWSPKFGAERIKKISYKMLSEHVTSRVWVSNKTHNNYVSALREMFTYALDHEYVAENPAQKLRMLKVQRPEPEPYTVAEAQALVDVAFKTHGDIDGIYWQIAFLLGMRPGEQISAKWADWNKITGRLTVRRMRTEGESKERTKTATSRHVDLPPAAAAALNRLRALTALRGDYLFVDYETGEQIDRSTVMQERWVLLHKIAGVSYREPYQCRHSSVSWKLMAGENWMKVSKHHGHSLATMLKTYAHWIDTESDRDEIALIRAFHGWVDSQQSQRVVGEFRS